MLGYRQVLQIYVHELKSCEMAEEYCDEIWKASQTARARPEVSMA
jgi:hypothetical protein